LIIEKTIGPLIDEKWQAFESHLNELASDRRQKGERLRQLAELDPATAMLTLKVCDPAMGSGHFLVTLVDYLGDRILEAIARSQEAVTWAEPDAPYESPLIRRIEALRTHIREQAQRNRWHVPEAQLDDRHLIRRIILKRVVHGVDMNPMAVELAKVSLWLHTFTVGAPLSFLDHHLQCGNSLYGERVRRVMDELSKRFRLLINPFVQQAKQAAAGVIRIQNLSDSDIGEVKSSAETFASVVDDTAGLKAILDVRQGLRWVGLEDFGSRNLHPSMLAIFDGTHGDAKKLLTQGGLSNYDDGGQPAIKVTLPRGRGRRMPEFSGQDILMNSARALARARERAREQVFLHWEIAFPDVWDNWDSEQPSGGFDAIIGNPPWDRLKMQEVEWFAARRREIAMQQRASDPERMIANLRQSADPLAADYERARNASEAAAQVARTCDDYPLLSYSLFVERALSLIQANGLVGLLVPSGIASDKSASDFFKSVSTTSRLAHLYDFENRRPPLPHFFPDVDSRFKFCALVVGGKSRHIDGAHCAFFLRDVAGIEDDNRAFTLKPENFAAINPNTGTAPVFRCRRDAELTAAIYSRCPVLVDRSSGEPQAAYPVDYTT
jgi:hypothetical protein